MAQQNRNQSQSLLEQPQEQTVEQWNNSAKIPEPSKQQ